MSLIGKQLMEKAYSDYPTDTWYRRELVSKYKNLMKCQIQTEKKMPLQSEGTNTKYKFRKALGWNKSLSKPSRKQEELGSYKNLFI